MGSSLPSERWRCSCAFGVSVKEGDVVLADVSQEGVGRRLVIRRAYRKTEEDVDGLYLEVDVPGQGEPFDVDGRFQRDLAVLVEFQGLA